jgi:lipopolysaccharide export system ATP-binding protein
MTDDSQQSGPILTTHNLVKKFKGRTVVSDVSLEVSPGEVVGLLGANGAGKTTTFSMVVGLLKPTRGTITFNGKNVTKYPMYKRAQAGMAYLAQEASVFRDLTSKENILAILEHQPMNEFEREARAGELLEELDITHIVDSKAYTLSGGERRRVEICRALAIDPKVFLLDEPFAGIDPIAVADLQVTVSMLKERGIAVLITDHNVRETLAITDRAYILNDGKILTHGTPKEIAEDPVARKVYLGESFKMDFTQ